VGGPIAPLAARTGGNGSAIPPSRDPVGVYRTTTHVGARANAGVMVIRREKGELVAEARDVGMVFDGVTGKGTWGDGGVNSGGVTEAMKVR